MTPLEQRIAQLDAQFERNVEKHNHQFNRDFKRICLIAGAVVLALAIIQALILWLYTN